MEKLSNLIAYDEYLVEGEENFEIDENSSVFESDDSDDLVYSAGNLYEALRMTGQQRKRAQNIGELMSLLNKRPAYMAAAAKFIKIMKVEAKKTVRENGLNPKVLRQLEKVTLRDINK